MTSSISPSHYNQHTYQPINVIEDWNLGFCLGNVIKYIARHKSKGKNDDLQKALFYLVRHILTISGEDEPLNIVIEAVQSTLSKGDAHVN